MDKKATFEAILHDYLEKAGFKKNWLNQKPVVNAEKAEHRQEYHENQISKLRQINTHLEKQRDWFWSDPEGLDSKTRDEMLIEIEQNLELNREKIKEHKRTLDNALLDSKLARALRDARKKAKAARPRKTSEEKQTRGKPTCQKTKKTTQTLHQR